LTRHRDWRCIARAVGTQPVDDRRLVAAYHPFILQARADEAGTAHDQNHPSEFRGESPFVIPMFVEVLVCRLDVTFLDAFDHIRIIFKIPFLVDLEIAGAPILEIADLDKVMLPRSEDTGRNRLGNVGVPREVPFLIKHYAAKEQFYNLNEVVIGIVDFELAIDWHDRHSTANFFE
jgi:hypothetical protein